MTASPFSMPLEDVLYGRCSTRAYLPGHVDALTVHALVAAAVRAPTAMHAEPWQFVIVQEPRRLRLISDRARQTLRADVARMHPDGPFAADLANPDFDLLYGAGTLIVICTRVVSPFGFADCWLAAENLMLAAHAIGLGTCVIGSVSATLNEPEIKRELCIPRESAAVAPIIVGRPAGPLQATPRGEPNILAWR